MKIISTVIIFSTTLSILYCDNNYKEEAVNCFISYMKTREFRPLFRECCQTAVNDKVKNGGPFINIFAGCLVGNFNTEKLKECKELAEKANFTKIKEPNETCLEETATVDLDDPIKCEPWINDVENCAIKICSRWGEVYEEKTEDDIYANQFMKSICEWVKKN